MKNAKIIATLFCVSFIFIGFIGFFIAIGLSSDAYTGITYKEYPFFRLVNLQIDSNENLYVGREFPNRIQVYDRYGVYQFSYAFQSFGGAYWFEVKDNTVFIHTARKDKKYVFQDKFLISENSSSLPLCPTPNDYTFKVQDNENNEFYNLGSQIMKKDTSGNVQEWISTNFFYNILINPLLYFLFMAMGMFGIYFINLSFFRSLKK